MKIWPIIWLFVLTWMAAGCSVPLPGQDMGPGVPDGKVVETPSATPTQGRVIDPPSVPADAQALVDLARADLALKLGDKADTQHPAETIALLSVEKLEFPDTSLGVPEPDKMYAQVITPGYVIRFSVGETVYTYHGSGERVVLVPDTQSSNELSAAALERALGSRMLNDPAALCEWQVLGSGEQVLYLWAVCESASGSAVSAPAVVYLDAQGRVAAVNMPGDGTQYAVDLRRLFPPEVQERILAHAYDARAAMDRIDRRRAQSQ